MRLGSCCGRWGVVQVRNTTDHTRQFFDGEIAKWARIITAAGVKADDALTTTSPLS